MKQDLDGAGIVSKVRTASDGSRYGGQPLVRGAIYLMLQNRIYRGEIVHKSKSYPGEHEAIIDETLWNNVQAILAENRVDRAIGTKGSEPNLLTGILFDAHGGRMSPTHANKKGTRYRYYISRSLLDASTKARSAGQRIPAAALESLVIHRIRNWLADPLPSFGPFNMPPPTQQPKSGWLSALDILPRATMTSGFKASAHLCAQASCVPKSMWTALILRWIRIGSFGALTKQPSKPSRSTKPNPRSIAK